MSALSDGPPPPTANQEDRPTADHHGPGQRQAQSQGSSRPRNRGHRGRGGRGAASGVSNATAQTSQAPQHAATPSSAAVLPSVNPTAPTFDPKATKPSANPDAVDDGGDADTDVCFICANPIGHISIAPCNHSTCHICGLRMRALYKDNNCAHCRTPAPYVIFTDDSEKKFEDYTEQNFTTSDSNIGIKYTNEDIVGDTVLLLRYNCPDADCDFAGLGWPDLHRHVKTVHKKRMCDLCTRYKKVFTHEHELFTDRELEKHMRRGDDKPGAADQTGFKGHPMCGFCGERFYDDDKLYDHCRMKHERCFICDRRDSRQPHYYRNYAALEDHFKKDHFPCPNTECQEKKFVVFESEMDLQAHRVNEHGGKGLGREARMVDMSNFDIRQSYQPPANRERRARGGRGRGRDPNAVADTTAPTAQALRRDEAAFQRQLAIHSAQSVSTRNFGGQLTAPSSTTTTARSPTANASPSSTTPVSSTPPPPSRSSPNTPPPIDTASMTPEDRARLVRHSAVVERASNLVGNDAQKMAAFRNHISTYRRGGFTAPQLIDALFTLFADASAHALGTLIKELAELFEERNQSEALRTAWQDWRAINEDYPSLPGLSGMHGATSSSSGWAVAAAGNPAMPTNVPSQKHSNRVLKLKNSTRLGGPSPGTGVPPGWARAPAVRPPTSAAFPSLPKSSRPAQAPAASRPSWLTGSPAQTPGPSARRSQPVGGDAFPALPSAPKPTTTIFGYGTGRGVRRDVPGQASSSFQWGNGTSGSSANGGTSQDPSGEEANDNKGKKAGKKGKKQVLVQWG